jgi:hypothetical protein
VNISATDLRASYEQAVKWLVNSHVRTPDGGYHSIYKPKTREYGSWCANQTCLLSTSGAVLVLNSLGYAELASHSAEHICQLAINSHDELRGALLSGRESRFVFTNWMSTAIVALLQTYQRTQVDKFRQVAVEAGKFISRKMQNADGSITQHVYLAARTDNLRRLARPRHIWLANSVEAFLKLYEVTGEQCFKSSADRFINWLAEQQRVDGSFPRYQHSLMSRVAVGLQQRSLAEMLFGCRQGHPASHTQSLKALMLGGRIHEAELSARWLTQRLSPNGLLYQLYFRDGTHSVEEDVMPTAHFGLILLEYPELGATKELLMRIASGLVYAQICSADRNADGASRGLPLHPTRGEHAYCWDTGYSILFLQTLLRHESTWLS